MTWVKLKAYFCILNANNIMEMRIKRVSSNIIGMPSWHDYDVMRFWTVIYLFFVAIEFDYYFTSLTFVGSQFIVSGNK